LVAALLHFLELEPELQLLRSMHNVGLMEDKVDALWTLVRVASESLASHIVPLVTRNPPDGAGE
jgi:hypothetical protein